jgi:hypothetical protein
VAGRARWNGNWNAKHFKVRGKTLQPVLSVPGISDVIRKRLGRPEADPDVDRVPITLVVTDESVVGIIRWPVIRGGDGLLEIGIGERDDVSGPCPQRGKVHTAF